MRKYIGLQLKKEKQMATSGDQLLRTLMKAINTMVTELNNPELPAQTILTLLEVMLNNELPMGELVKTTSLSQAAVSRIVTRLGSGMPPEFDGARVVEANEDPYFRKRKLVKLTLKGEKLKGKLVDVLLACK